MDWIGWIGWILLRSLVQLEHLAVLINYFLRAVDLTWTVELWYRGGMLSYLQHFYWNGTQLPTKLFSLLIKICDYESISLFFSRSVAT